MSLLSLKPFMNNQMMFVCFCISLVFALCLLQFATVYKARDKTNNNIVAIKKVRRLINSDVNVLL